MTTYTGSNTARQEVGLPGHCDDCAAHGHVAAHPTLGCGDVGCTETHDQQTAVSTTSDALPVKVAAYLCGDKEDPSSRALFANSDRAEQYARMLADSRQYATVCLWDAQGQCWEVPAAALVTSDGREV